MTELDKVSRALARCYRIGCRGCPYNNADERTTEKCVRLMHQEALVLIQKQQAIIDRYSRADVFLAAHGWTWEEDDMGGDDW